MPEINIPGGPIESEPLAAIVTKPAESSLRVKVTALEDALASVELGAHDRVVLAWLAGWEPSTVATVCSWLHRVREVSRGA